MGFGFWVLGFRFWVLGFWVSGLGFLGFGFWVSGFRFRCVRVCVGGGQYLLDGERRGGGVGDGGRRRLRSRGGEDRPVAVDLNPAPAPRQKWLESHMYVFDPVNLAK